MRWKKQNLRTKRSYLEYYKTILVRVSFYNKLMRKEYLKAKSLITPLELKSLDRWLIVKNLYKKLRTGV